MPEYTFDASITVEVAGSKQDAADEILEGAAATNLAVSLFDDGTLNVKTLQSKLDRIRQKCEAGASAPVGTDYPYGDGYRQACADVLAILEPLQ